MKKYYFAVLILFQLTGLKGLYGQSRLSAQPGVNETRSVLLIITVDKLLPADAQTFKDLLITRELTGVKVISEDYKLNQLLIDFSGNPREQRRIEETATGAGLHAINQSLANQNSGRLRD